MSTSLTLYPEENFNSFLIGRVTLDQKGTQWILKDKLIDFPLAFNVILAVGNHIHIGPLFFVNCAFKKDVYIGSYIYTGNITFEDCTFEANAVIQSMSNVAFNDNCQFKKDATFSFDSSSKATLSGISVDGTLNITGDTNKQFTIQKINIGKVIQNQKIALSCQSRGFVLENIRLNELEIISYAARSEYKNEIRMLDARKLILRNNSIDSSIQIRGSNIVEMSFDDISGTNSEIQILHCPRIHLLSIPLSRFRVFRILDCDIHTLILTESNDKDSILSIRVGEIKNFIFQEIYNSGIISLRDLIVPAGGKISIRSSNLGKTDFILCNFTLAILEFENSKITEVFIAETDFPKRVLLNNKENYSQSQLAFGQFSTAFQKQGDTVKSLEYQAREIEAHYKQLPFYDKNSNKISFTKMSLFLNKWSNDFGRSWQRGIVFSILGGILFFYLVILSSQQYSFGFPISFDHRFIAAYFKFMNPLRFLETESLFRVNQDKPYLNLSVSSYFWDFLGRVLVAYGFYQTIQAFRRFGRK